VDIKIKKIHDYLKQILYSIFYKIFWEYLVKKIIKLSEKKEFLYKISPKVSFNVHMNDV